MRTYLVNNAHHKRERRVRLESAFATDPLEVLKCATTAAREIDRPHEWLGGHDPAAVVRALRRLADEIEKLDGEP